MSKNTVKTDGVAVSDVGAQTEDTASSKLAVRDPGVATVESVNGDVIGTLDLSLSQEMRDSLTAEFLDALHQVQEGFGELTAPGDIFATGLPFFVVDAATIEDYEDQSTGEVKIKHIFRLEFADGTVKSVMQSDARPRRVLAKAFTSVRKLGARMKAGPYMFEKKLIPRQIQPAFIFRQMPGFKAAPVV